MDTKTAQTLLDPEKMLLARSRRRFMTQAGLVGLGLAGATQFGSRVAAQTPQVDADVLNFALNLEYLEAEYYLRAVTGSGLSAADISGTGTPGGVVVKAGSTVVPWVTPAIREYAEEIAADELAHVRFIRAALTSLGAAPVARPAINLRGSFTSAAVAAGIIAVGGSGASCPPGRPSSPRPGPSFVPTADCNGWVPMNHPLASSAPPNFDPFADELSFLLGAFIFEDVGVTAYKGAAKLLTNPTVLEAAAGILAVEAYHAATVRTVLSMRGAVDPVQKISNLRDAADGAGDLDQGLRINLKANIVPTDVNGIVYSRTTAQILNIVYLGGASANFGFFPNQLNGAIR